MRIAILGAGFAGLAVTWFLLHYTQGKATIDLFDGENIGGGASGLSSGLLHPFMGKKAHRAWKADSGLRETHRLITEASRAVGRTAIFSKGILRPAITHQQIEDFKKCAETYSEVSWLDQKKCLEKVPGLVLPETGGGLFIENGLTIDVASYLEGLWQACALLGTQFHQQFMIQPQELAPFDRVLIAMGAASIRFPPLKNLPIEPVKGQLLELKWPSHLPPLPFSLNSSKYLVMHPNGTSCIAGATFEHNFSSPQPDMEIAKKEILPAITSYFPSLATAEILACHAGVRASSPNHLPVAGKLSDKVYFFTGLGSRGLLYHAWLGKRVARMLLTKDPRHLPPEIYSKIN